MKSSLCFLLGLLCLSQVTLSYASHSPAFVEQEFVLSASQVTELTAQALDGSGPSALKLSRFYSNVTLNLEVALRWAIIGAENGDSNCEYTAYGFLSRRESPDDQRRALFWLRKAASQGYKPAIDHLKIRSQADSKGCQPAQTGAPRWKATPTARPVIA
jgi:TPR repeat protein